MKKLLVSLVSDQTIPNVQLIKEFRNETNKYLFITTRGMEEKGTRESIIKACQLEEEELLDPVKVDPFSFDDMEEQLDKVDFEEFERVIVNLTGGTKVMTLAAFDYFKEVGADIYYLTGKDDMIKVSPGRKKNVEKVESSVNVKEYLTSYGFELEESTPSNICPEYTEKIFQIFINGDFNQYSETLKELRTEGRKKKNTSIEKVDGLEDFLNHIEFPLSNTGKISKHEAKYLTGEWFEEFVTNRLKNELNLSSDNIATGLQITKKNRNGEPVPNEMDVLLVWKNRIHTIECKTSVFYEEIQPDGTSKTKSIIAETLFKSDSLQKGLGLFANTFLFILDSLDEVENRLRPHLKRAELFGIKVVDKDAISTTKSIRDLLSI